MHIRTLGLLLLLCGGLLLESAAPGHSAPASPPAFERRLARTDALEIVLTAPAASAARSTALSARRIGAESAPRARLGVPALDGFAASQDARFEAVFPGESGGEAPGGLDAFYRVLVRDGADLDALISRLRDLPEVLSVDRIAIGRVALMPNDSLWSVSTWFYQPSRRDVHAPEAWDVSTGDSAVVIAIADTGVLPWHPDLGGQLAGEPSALWRNADEANGVAGVDDDLNGYVDDVAGWDFVSLVSASQVIAGEDWSDADNDPSDFAGHGTQVASVAAGMTDNLRGIAGTAWRAKLMPLRVGYSAPTGPAGLVDMSWAASAIDYAVRNGARVVNCSFETLPQASLLAAVSAATHAGVLVVNAAGNGTTNIAVAQREDVLAVGSTDALDQVSTFSNRGPYVDVCAPGEGIATASLVHAAADSIGQRQPDYASGVGTSFSAPMVSGAIALLEARRLALGAPRFHPMELIFRVRETADDIAAENPSVSGYGSGRLNLHRALIETHTSRVLRMGSRTIGPAVVRRTRSGGSHVACVTNGNRFVVVDGVSLDTLANVSLPGRPAKQLAAADLGGAHGVGYFCGTINGRMVGLNENGAALPGWPFDSGNGVLSFTGGPALGDLDGDGELEVVSGATDGTLWAWRANGTLLDGFPISTSATALNFPVALANLDGVPGDEIVVTAASGWVDAIRWDGASAPGWPVVVTAPAPSTSPSIAPLGFREAILFGRGAELRALDPNGALRFSFSSGAPLVQDPIAADLDADGIREVAVAASQGATQLLTLADTLGAIRSGFPKALGASVTAGLVAGPMRPGAASALGVMLATGFAAFDDTAAALRGFPRPGLAGASASIASLDASDHAVLVATTGPDSLFYFYDAGPATWASPAGAWTTARANFARTGSASNAPELPALDDLAPSLVSDLAADSIGASGFSLAWTAPGDDGDEGVASGYELQLTTNRAEAGDFSAGGVRRDLAPPDSAGSAQRVVFAGLVSGTTYYASLRTRDPAGNWSQPSGVLAVTLPLGPAKPFAGEGPGLRPRTSPAVRSVELLWQAGEGAAAERHEIAILDVSGRSVRRFDLGLARTGALQWNGRDASGRRVPAGLYFARLSGAKDRAETRFVLLP